MYSVKIGVVGAGVVGSANALAFLLYGYSLKVYDVNPARLQQFNKPSIAESIKTLVLESDVVFITVDVPTAQNGQDLTNLRNCLAEIGEALRETDEYKVIAVRSTILPGTTEEFVIPYLERISGKKNDVDFSVVYNPEFLREKTALEDAMNPWALVIGTQHGRAIRLVTEAYERFNIPHERTYIVDYRTAEMIKYVSNLFNAYKITFANEIWRICSFLNINGNEVMKIVSKTAEGMWNSEYGTRGGYPFSGKCLPKDLDAFLLFLRKHGITSNIFNEVKNINIKLLESFNVLKENYSLSKGKTVR